MLMNMKEFGERLTKIVEIGRYNTIAREVGAYQKEYEDNLWNLMCQFENSIREDERLKISNDMARLTKPSENLAR